MPTDIELPEVEKLAGLAASLHLIAVNADEPRPVRKAAETACHAVTGLISAVHLTRQTCEALSDAIDSNPPPKPPPGDPSLN